MKDMLSDILGQYAERQHKQLQLKVYDGEKILAENLLFESKPFNGKVYFSRVYSVIHNNRTWTLVYYQSGYHFPVTPYIKVGWILLIGSFFSFLLFFLIQSMLTTQEKVKVMAGRLSADLVESENKATMASKAKGEFLANMSHEIRTPINGILSMASLLNMSELTPEQSKYSNLIYSSAENLNTLVSSILDYSKIEAGKLDMEFIDFDIVVFIYRLRTVFELQAEKKGLSFVVSMGQTIPSLIKGAEKSLEQILSNFIGNAIKFTENGSIVLEVKIEAELDENISFIFGVRDTGVGIPKEKANELFQVFSQVDNSISRKYGGSGLGLAISKQLAILMGGTVGFESEEGKGSYFWVVIPFKKAIKPQLNNTDNFLLPNFNTPLLPAVV
jgi:signal transduction histidine kinase